MPDVRSGDDDAALPRRMDRLAGAGPGEASGAGGEQFKVHRFPLGRGKIPCFEGAVDGPAAACRRLGCAPRLPAAVGGDLRRCDEVRCDLLPRGQLAEDRHDEGAQGARAWGRQDAEGCLRLPPGAELQVHIAERTTAGQAPAQAAAGLRPGRSFRAALERHHRNGDRRRQRPRPGLAAAPAGAEHASDHAVHLPAGVLEGPAGLCDHPCRALGPVPGAGDRTAAADAGVGIGHVQRPGQAGRERFQGSSCRDPRAGFRKPRGEWRKGRQTVERAQDLRRRRLEDEPAASIDRGRLPDAVGQCPLPAGPGQLPVPVAAQAAGRLRSPRARERTRSGTRTSGCFPVSSPAMARARAHALSLTDRAGGADA